MNLTAFLHDISPRTRFGIGVLILMISSICFSTKAILIKLMYLHHVDTISVITLRMFFSLPFYVIILFFLNRQERKNNAPPVAKSDILKIGLLGILSYYVSSMLDFWGLKYISAGVERLILFTYPTIVIILSAIFFKKKITTPQYLALLLTYFGVAITFLAERGLGEQKNFAFGAMLIACCAFTYAFFVLFTSEVAKRVGSLQFTCYAMIGATIPTLIQSIWYNGMDIFNFSSEIYGLTVWLVLVATLIPTFFLVEGIRVVGAANSSIIGFVGPVSTIFLANIFLSERITVWQLVGTALVLLGISLVTRKGKA
ncbi:MAG: hypothetical protein RL757_2427 [Bacteroidota bacterium]